MKKTPQTVTMSKAEHASMKQELERLRMQAEQAAARYEQAERARLAAEAERANAERARLAAEAERLEAQARAAKLEAEKTLLKETLEEERAHLHKIIKELFARKSERYHSQEPAEGQLSLFAEQLVKLAQSPQAQKTGAAASSKPGAAKRKHPGRRPIPKDLPRLDLTLEPEEDITGCVKIGEEITEELDYIPGCFFVRRFIRPKYSRPEQAGVAIAPAPLRVIPKGIPGPMLLAYILVSKYMDHLPLYRQLEMFRRSGMDINDATIGGWVKQAIQLLEVIYHRIRNDLLESDYLMADESTIKVLDRDKKGATHQGYYWAYLDPLRRCALFMYEKGRGGIYVRTHLKNFSGHLQTDAYAAYATLPTVKTLVRLVGCWAHARRKFVDALSAEKEQADWFLKQIQLLYAIERFCHLVNLKPEERLALRENAIPILQGIKERMEAVAPTLTPKNVLSTAIRYSLNQWDELTVYTTDGRLEIDNNLVENSIRPIALGRKNYLFAGDHDAAQRGAVMYSLIASCKARQINPLAYLADVLDKLPARKVNNIDDLLPWNWKPVNLPMGLDKM